jgi:hypothetical protein
VVVVAPDLDFIFFDLCFFCFFLISFFFLLFFHLDNADEILVAIIDSD